MDKICCSFLLLCGLVLSLAHVPAFGGTSVSNAPSNGQVAGTAANLAPTLFEPRRLQSRALPKDANAGRLRSTEINLNRGYLESVVDGTKLRFNVELFDGQIVTLQLVRKTSRAAIDWGAYFFSGEVIGYPDSDADIYIHSGQVTGGIRLGVKGPTRGNFSVESLYNGAIWLHQLDTSRKLLKDSPGDEHAMPAPSPPCVGSEPSVIHH